MKHVFITVLLTLFYSFANAQSCKELVNKDLYQESYFLEEPILLQQGDAEFLKIYLSVPKDKSMVKWTFEAHGANCIGEGSLIDIVFTDQTKMRMYNVAPYNCEEQSVMYFGAIYKTEKQLRVLCTKYISIIRVYGVSRLSEQYLSTEQSKLLREALICMDAVRNQ